MITNSEPVNRRLCLNMRVARQLGYDSFVMSSTGVLWGFRPPTDADENTTTIDGVVYALDVLPDYSADLNAAWSLDQTMLEDWFEWSMTKRKPESVARSICINFLRHRAARRNAAQDHG